MGRLNWKGLTKLLVIPGFRRSFRPHPSCRPTEFSHQPSRLSNWHHHPPSCWEYKSRSRHDAAPFVNVPYPGHQLVTMTPTSRHAQNPATSPAPHCGRVASRQAHSPASGPVPLPGPPARSPCLPTTAGFHVPFTALSQTLSFRVSLCYLPSLSSRECQLHEGSSGLSLDFCFSTSSRAAPRPVDAS